MRVACSSLACAGAFWIASSFSVVAAPVNGPAIRDAAAEIGVTENVHCRPFRHPHRWGYGRGCARGAVVIDEGIRVRSRFGYRTRGDVRFRGGFRTRDDAGVRFRGRERDGVSGSNMRGGTTIRGGASGSVEPRGSIADGQAREGTGGNRGSAEGPAGMRTAPVGQRMQGGAGQGGSPGAGSGAGTR